MGQQIHLDGMIKLFKNNRSSKNKLKALSFKFPVKKPEIVDCLMTEFKSFNFSEKEKQVLSAKHRKKICEFNSINEKDLAKYSAKLVKELKQFKDDTITIKATEFGAFICLAAIFSGKLPQNSNWTFELSGSPIKLFPKKLVKNKHAGEAFNVSIVVSPECWLKPFKSLIECPKYMSLSYYKQDDLEEHYSLDSLEALDAA